MAWRWNMFIACQFEWWSNIEMDLCKEIWSIIYCFEWWFISEILFKIQNRTFLNLRAKNGSGFVGIKSPIGQQQQLNGKLESNKTTPDSIKIEYANSDNLDVDGGDGHDGILKINCCYLKMTSNNKYLSLIDGNSVAADASSLACAQQWQLELRTGTFMAIRTIESSSYLNLTGNGSVQVNACSPDQATLWEFWINLYLNCFYTSFLFQGLFCM